MLVHDVGQRGQFRGRVITLEFDRRARPLRDDQVSSHVGHLAQGFEQRHTQRSARCPRNSGDESHQPTAPKWWTVGAVGVNRGQAGSVSGVPVRMKPTQAERI